MRDDMLVSVDLELGIPNFWENKVAREFGDSSFVIRDAYPVGDDEFKGFFRAEDVLDKKITNFFKKNIKDVEVKPFHFGSNLFGFFEKNSSIAGVLRDKHCVLNWPVSFSEDSKRLKVLMNFEDVDSLLGSFEAKGIEILKFSKVETDLELPSILTSRQIGIFKPTLKMGYYDFPRRISMNLLAKKLNISPSTLCVHLQKIESKILNSDYSNYFLGSKMI